MSVAVTGATGFIGRRLVEALQQSGHHVAALARHPDRARAALPSVDDVREWSLGETRAEHLRDIDVVCHLAAFIPPNLTDPAYAERCVVDNAMGTQRLLEGMRRSGARRLVYFSTGQLYRWKDAPVTEDDPVDPARRAPYYLGSKLLGEIFARHAGMAGLLDVAVLRVGSVYGPGMGSRATVQRLIDDAVAGRAACVADGGQYGVDFVFVDDVVRATVATVASAAAGVFNIGSGVRTTMVELAEAIVRRFGGPDPVIEPARSDSDIARGFPALDVSRARRELGYIPTSLVDGISRMTPSTSR